MRHTIRFKVKNRIRITQPIPIELDGKIFFVETTEGFITKVGVTFKSLPASSAPKFSRASNGEFNLSFAKTSENTLEAERMLRAWQSVLAAYALIDIDFDDTEEEFRPESISEEAEVEITKFQASKGIPDLRTTHEFAILGRAFLAIPVGIELIEETSFYIDGVRSLRAGRSIDAYNNFYLFLESRYKLKHKNKEAIQGLLTAKDVMAAISKQLSDPFFSNKSPPAFVAAIANWAQERKPLIKEIVELRGFLRHHSLANPNRWNPIEAQKYQGEAIFLAGICQSVLNPAGFGKTWEEPYIYRYYQQAEKLNQVINIIAQLTFDAGQGPQSVSIRLRYPTPDHTPMLAKRVLEDTLKTFDQKSPGAELYGIRARVEQSGAELFRYDLGPGIARSSDAR